MSYHFFSVSVNAFFQGNPPEKGSKLFHSDTPSQFETYYGPSFNAPEEDYRIKAACIRETKDMKMNSDGENRRTKN
jgi:hypothetical protein